MSGLGLFFLLICIIALILFARRNRKKKRLLEADSFNSENIWTNPEPVITLGSESVSMWMAMISVSII